MLHLDLEIDIYNIVVLLLRESVHMLGNIRGIAFRKTSILCSTLYIDINGTVVFNNLRILRYNGEGESVVHLMSKEHGL